MFGLFAPIYFGLLGISKIVTGIKNNQLDSYMKDKAIKEGHDTYLDHNLNTVNIKTGQVTKKTINDKFEKIEIDIHTKEIVRNYDKEREQYLDHWSRNNAKKNNRKKYYAIYYFNEPYNLQSGIKYELQQLGYQSSRLNVPCYKKIDNSDNHYYVNLFFIRNYNFYYDLNQHMLIERDNDQDNESYMQEILQEITEKGIEITLNYNYGDYIDCSQCYNEKEVIDFFNSFSDKCCKKYGEYFNPYKFGNNVRGYIKNRYGIV